MSTVLNWGNPLHKPYSLFLLGFGVITAYIPGIVGASVSTGWLFLFIIIPPFLLFYCDIKLGIGFIFICYAIISLMWTENLNIAWFHLLQLIILACVFCIGQNIKDLTPVFKGLTLGLGISGVISIFQYFKFNFGIYAISGYSAGLFINPNIFSEISAIILVGLVVLKLWWWIPFTFCGLLLVQSRTAYLALSVGLLIAVWKYNKYLAIGVVSFISILGIFFYWNNFNMPPIQERLDIWVDTIQGFKFFGNGVGSFEALFPYYATHIDTEISRPRYAHNDLLNVVFEFGIASILFLMVLLNAFRSKKPEVFILFTVCIISLFTYPMHVPTSAFIAFLVAGFISDNNVTYGNIWTDRGSSLFERIKRGEPIKA